MNIKKPLASLLALALALGSFPAHAVNIAAPVEAGVARPGTGMFGGLTSAQSTQFAASLATMARTLPLSGVKFTGGSNVVPAGGALATPMAAAEAVRALSQQAFAPAAVAADPIAARANATLLAALWAEPRLAASIAANFESLGTPEGLAAAQSIRTVSRVYHDGVVASRSKLRKEFPGLKALTKLGSADRLFDGSGAFAAMARELPESSEGAVDAAAAIGGPKLDVALRPASRERVAAARSGRFANENGVITVDRPVDLPLYRPTAGEVKPSITTRWIPAALAKDDAAAQVLLANYAPTQADIENYDQKALTELRVTTREDSMGLYAELRALPTVETGPAAAEFAALRQQLLDGDNMAAMRSIAAISAVYAPGTVVSKDVTEEQAGLVDSIQSRLTDMYGLQIALKTAIDHLKMSGDGIGRTAVHYWSPEALRAEQLRRGWGEPKLGEEPVSDVVMVGGGPAGLAAAYYLSEANGKNDPGLKTVLIEGGYVGQAFSDGGSPSVHWLRTGRWTTSFASSGAAPARHVAQIGLPRVSEFLGFKPKGQAARADIEGRTGARYIGRSREERKLARYKESKNPLLRAWGFLNGLFFYALRERIHPLARNEIFQYFNHTGSHIAENPNAIVLEQSPVTHYRKRPDGIWEVKTAQGHTVLARRLVIGTGIVGTDADFAQVPKEFTALSQANPGKYLAVAGNPDLSKKAGELSAMFNERARTGHFGQQFMFTGTMLRTPEAQRWLKSLPAGSRVGVIGSGESAAKDVIDILIQNPELKVAIFAKSQFEPAQVQVPEGYFSAELAKRGIVDKDFQKFSVDQWKRVFGTPITPQTFLDMITAQKEGRVEVYELGKHFTEAMMQLAYREGIAGGGTEVEITDTEVVRNLLAQKKIWAEKYGLKLDIGEHMGPEGTHLRIPFIDGGWVFSTGFAAGQTRYTPQMQELIDGGHVGFNNNPDAPKWFKGQLMIHPENNISSAYDTTLAFTGISFYNPAGDSTISGMGVRGRYIGDYMKKSLREEARTREGVATMSLPTLERLGNMPTYKRLPGTQGSYAKRPSFNVGTVDPSTLLWDILPWPFVTGLVYLATNNPWVALAMMLPVPFSLFGSSRWLPGYKEVYSHPIDVITRRVLVKRRFGLPLSGIDRLLGDRGSQIADRQALPRDRFHFGEWLQAVGGLLTSFRWYRPFAVPERLDEPGAVERLPAAASAAPRGGGPGRVR